MKSRPPRLLALGLLALVALGGCRTPGAFELTDQTRPTARPVALRAGTGEAVFTPPLGYPLGGFGGGARRAEWPLYFGMGWPGRASLGWRQLRHEEGHRRADMLVPARGVHDELTARALVLRPADGPPVALVRIDAIATTRELHDLVVAGLKELGYRESTVLLAATHTHSGVGAFHRAPLARAVGMDNFRPEVEALIASACVRAVREAHAAARPAALGVGRARDEGPDGPQVARNRAGLPDDAIDPEVLLLRVDDLEAGAPMAVVLNYAVHGTVLGQKNLHFSGDVADGIEDALGARLGGVPVLFLNGAEGDIAPARPPGPGGFERIRALGERMADLVVPALAEIEAAPEARLVTATADLEMGDAHIVFSPARERFVAAYRHPASYLLTPLTLPLDLTLWVAGLTNVRTRLTYGLAPGLVIDLDGLVGRTRTRVGGLRVLTAREDVAFLCVPGEATHDVGLSLKEAAAARGATATFVVGLALDHVGYIASEAQYLAGRYEARLTLFGPETAARVERALGKILTALGYPAQAGGGAAVVERPADGS
ncbi:MAG: neutral/alkaline non-lysosomal ceramidase N-terminal domain-containing protein [Planctomycetes bacterium]|nr:neutral/alkaline non-lysosomal ceramidase N-terminal domain-containing protein [Planctomycetota bacterium]